MESRFAAFHTEIRLVEARSEIDRRDKLHMDVGISVFDLKFMFPTHKTSKIGCCEIGEQGWE
jgi:hypothetical protein